MGELEKLSTNEIAQYLRRNRNCAFILWQTDDAIEKAKEMEIELSEEEAIEVLQGMDSKSDCEYGITWDHVEFWIEKIKEENYVHNS